VAKKKTRPTKKVAKKKEKTFSPGVMHIIALLTFLLLCIAFFYPQLQGKVITQSDVVSFKASSHEIHTYAEQDGHYPLWTNSMFGGMPAYQIAMPTSANRTAILEKAANLFIGRPIGYFIAMMIGFYIMCLSFRMRPLVALIGSIAFGLTVNHFVLFEAGHMTKLRAFAFFGIIVAGIVNTYRGKYFMGSLLFALGVALEVGVNHIQMPYYLFITLLIYIGILFYRDVKDHNIMGFVKASGFLLIALVIGLAANTSRLWTTMDYAEDTMRGKPILTKNVASTASSSEVQGLAWDYAMQWSNGAVDVMTYLVPGIAGGGSREPVDRSSEFARITGQNQSTSVFAPLYWGSLPFTSGPSYVGAIVIFLFLLGAITIRGDMRWWLVSATVLTILFSMGKNAAWINHLFFDYFPMFNKFRTPNSISSITEFLMILMATWTLSEIVNGKVQKDRLLKNLFISGGIMIGLCLFFAVAGSSLFSFTSPNDANYDPRLVEALISDRKSLLQADALRSALFIAAGAGLIYYFLKGKLKSMILLGSLAVLVTIDLWGVGRRYLNPSSFVRANRSEAALQPREVDNVISKDKDPYFRVFDLSVNTFNSSIPSYHQKTIGGYHPAKLQRYQDLIDYYISKNNMPVLNMLNTKYIIDQNGQLQVNTQALGNAWFVNEIKLVKSSNEEIESLASIDLSAVAVVHEEFGADINNQTFQKNGAIELTSYHPERLAYKSNSSSDQFAVFSEIWYGPNKGWYATIDGNPTDIIRVDYALRGLNIPSGNHEIIFEFRPRSFYTGEIISNISSIFLLIILILWCLNYFNVVQLPFLKKELV